MRKVLSCEFNLDTACVELRLDDGTLLSIDCTAVENEVANSMYQRSELDWLIYNDPLSYAELILNGEPELYLKAVTEYGHFDIVLADFLKQNSISKNQLSEKANLQRTQLNSYCKNNIKRPDLDVLARICYALNCELSDIIRYVHPNERNGEKGNG